MQSIDIVLYKNNFSTRSSLIVLDSAYIYLLAPAVLCWKLCKVYVARSSNSHIQVIWSWGRASECALLLVLFWFPQSMSLWQLFLPSALCWRSLSQSYCRTKHIGNTHSKYEHNSSWSACITGTYSMPGRNKCLYSRLGKNTGTYRIPGWNADTYSMSVVS